MLNKVQPMESLDALIDRMVDAPLPPAELREAVARLDAVPVAEGWRRCGLAFLEAQCWGDAMRSAANEQGRGTIASATPGNLVAERAVWSPPPTVGEGQGEGATASDRRDPLCAERARLELVPASRSQAYTPPSPQPSPTVGGGSEKIAAAPWLMAAAAVILLAVGGGLGWLGAGGAAARHQPEPAAGSESLQVAASSEAKPERTEPVAASPEAIPGLPVDRLPTVREVARLRLGDGPGRAEVPILDGPGIDARRLMEQPPVVSEYQQAALRAEGYELKQDRRLVPVRLGDGRTAAVPVDRVRVRYVGNDPL